jgi:putative ABC transport system ATP-binding protein
MITLNGIKKSYQMGSHAVEALKSIDLQVTAKEMVAIMGPSGSGKSTLMNILGCLDRPSAGVYTLDGRNVSHLDADELAQVRNKKIGFVFQNFNLLSLDTALDNVALPLLYGRVADARKKAREAIRKVGLETRAHHKPSELSGGQRQRIAIARAIVSNPPLILADEPTGNLDTQTGEEILSIFAALNAAGTTVVMVTHEREVAEHCHRILTMRDGVLAKDERLAGSQIKQNAIELAQTAAPAASGSSAAKRQGGIQ